jgi:hypothetical protein
MHPPMTRSPVDRARASRPSRADLAVTVNAVVTVSNCGTTASLLSVAVPLGRSGVPLADARPRPHGRSQGDRHLNYYKIRDDLASTITPRE